MSEFFLELFSEEIPAKLQKNLREKILDDFKNFFDEKLIKSKNNFSLSSPNRLVIVFEGLDKLMHIKSQEIRGPKMFLALVHRIDRDTSGLLLIAKTPSSLRYMHEIFRKGEIYKGYLTLVHGRWPSFLKRINAPIKKNLLSSGERISVIHKDGKSAVTDFRVINQFPTATLLKARPLTGRTHQIRVHAMHAGYPIIGDKKYGLKQDLAQPKKATNRLFLHCNSLRFKRRDKKYVELNAALGRDLKDTLNLIKTEFN